MNKGYLSGFISSDIKVDDINLKDGNTMKKARFSIACQRKGKGKGADFIQVVALDKTAETLSKWFSKGKGIFVEYKITTGTYKNKEGKTIYTEEKLITDWEFPPVRKDEDSTPVDSPNSDTSPNNDTHTEEPQAAPDDSFMNIPDDITNDLPFR